MHTTALLTASLAALAASSPVATQDAAATKNKFEVTNFVFGCTNTCDWSFDVVDTNSQLPGHPGFSKPVHCKGSLGTTTSFTADSCGPISKTEQVAAFISKDNKLSLQYRVSIPGTNGEPGATYWFEGDKKVGAATGYNPSPPKFAVPETRAYAVA